MKTNDVQPLILPVLIIVTDCNLGYIYSNGICECYSHISSDHIQCVQKQDLYVPCIQRGYWFVRLVMKIQEKSYTASRHVHLIAVVVNVINVQISKKTGAAYLPMVAISANIIALDHYAALVKVHTACRMMLMNV